MTNSPNKTVDQQNKTERWENDFANLNFTYTDDYGNDALLEGGVEIVHNFITQLLSDARREERKKIVKIIKCLNCNDTHEPKDKIIQALTTAEESIKKLNKDEN